MNDCLSTACNLCSRNTYTTDLNHNVVSQLACIMISNFMGCFFFKFSSVIVNGELLTI